MSPPEDTRYLGCGNVPAPHPYLTREDYGRVRSERAFRAVVLQNEHLRATFLPETGRSPGGAARSPGGSRVPRSVH